jgi:acyl-ACP thioesterase
MDYAPRRIGVPEELRAGEPVQIKKHHLDTNHHVNNGQYVRIAMDSLNTDCKIRQLRAEYKRQVVLGDTLTPWMARTEDDRRIVVLKDQTDNICCIVELQEEKE